MKKKRNKAGFTLIEIIVVVAILAVLMAVAVPAVMSYLDEANEAKYIVTARSVMTNVQSQMAKAYAAGLQIGTGDLNAGGNINKQPDGSEGNSRDDKVRKFISYAVYLTNQDDDSMKVDSVQVFFSDRKKIYKIKKLKVNFNIGKGQQKSVFVYPNKTIETNEGFVHT